MLLAGLAAGLLLSAPIDAAEPTVRPWYLISWHTGRSTASVRILLSRVTPTAGGRPAFWVAERSGSPGFVDGRTCPALAEAARTLADMPTRLQRADENAPIDVISDAGFTAVKGPFHLKGGVVMATLEDQIGPLDQWRQATERALEPCWSKTPIPDIPSGAKTPGWLELLRD